MSQDSNLPQSDSDASKVTGLGLSVPADPTIPGQSSSAASQSSRPPSSPSVASSSRSKHTDIELSLPTQRRLIRKPLPDLPSLSLGSSSSSTPAHDHHSSAAAPPSCSAPDGDLASAWWPHELPTSPLTKDKKHLPVTQGHEKEPSAAEVDTLDAVCQEHLRTFLYHALQTEQGPLPSTYHLALFEALIDSLRTIADPVVLARLQRTACIRWRAEAQLRAAAAKNGSSQSGHLGVTAGSVLSSRWAKLGWPAAALRGMIQSRDTPHVPSSGPAQALEATLAESQQWRVSKEQRLHKRDVALAVLSNAVWLVSSYGSTDGSAQGQGTPKGTTDSRSSAARQQLHSAAQSRNTSRERRVPTKRGGLPNFIPPSAPTTALSASASPSIDVTEQPSERPNSLHLPSALVSLSAPPSDGGTPITTVDISSDQVQHNAEQQSQSALAVPKPHHSHAASWDVSLADQPSNAASRRGGSVDPMPSTSRPPSKAVERLSSLNAAAGAALKAQARAQADKDGASTDSTQEPCITSTAASRIPSEAEAAETAALEKAEREFIARVGANCEERAKMVLTSIMVEVRMLEEIGASELPTGSALSSDPNKTIGASTDSALLEKDKTLRPGHDSFPPPDTQCPIRWLPGIFRGQNLYADSPHIRHTAEAEKQRLKVEGGTFSIVARNESEGELLKATLAAALYTACSMRLECDLLANVGYVRPQPTSHPATDFGGTLPDQIPVGQGGEEKPRSVVSTELHTADTAPPSSPGRSSKRWQRGIWGILQSGTDAVQAALNASSAQGHRRTDTVSGHVASAAKSPTSPAPEKMFPRSLTADSVSLSKTPTQESANTPQRRAPVRLGRFFQNLVGGTSASNAGGAAANPHSWLFAGHEPSSNGEETSVESRRNRASLDAPGTQIGQEPVAARLLTDSLPGGSDDKRPPPSSVSPELSRLFTSDGTDPEGSCSAGGMEFLHRFMRAQTLNVLVGGRPSVPVPPRNLRAPASQGYFGSVTGSSIAPSLSSRSVSASSTTAESAVSDASSIPGTPALPTSSVSSVPPGQTQFGTPGPATASLQWSSLSRENVRFYRHAGSGRDIHLGQVIEDVCSRAEAIALRDDSRASQAPSEDAKKSEKIPTSTPLRYPIIHYLHGEFQVTVAARPYVSKPHSPEPPPAELKPQAAKETSSSSNAGDASATGSDGNNTAGSGAEKEGDTDVAAVATTLSADRDAARTAVALAEEAIQAAESEETTAPRPHSLLMWSADVRTGQQTQPTPVSDATWLTSFAHYLEAAMYHPGFASIEANEPNTGEQTEDAPPSSRFNIARLFRRDDVLVKVSIKPLTIFHLQTEGPVVLSRASRDAVKDLHHGEPRAKLHDVLELTRLQIQDFYSSVKEHIAELEDIIVERSLDQHGRTVKPQLHSPREKDDKGDETAVDSSLDSQSEDRKAALGSLAENSPLGLLTKLKTSFRETEFALYEAIKECDPVYINEIRKAFKDRCRSAKQRLSAWGKKHLTKDELSKQPSLARLREPDYMGPRQHPFPGSRYVVREDEPLSIIAFSLSSRDFNAEMRLSSRHRQRTQGKGLHDDAKSQPANKMADVLQWRSDVVPGGTSSSISLPSRGTDATQEPPTGSQISSSYQSIVSDLSFSTPKDRAPDPDLDSWFVDVEPVNVAMKRKKRGRDGSILSLSLRRVASASAVADQHNSTTSAVDDEAGSEGDESFEDDFTLAASGLDPTMVDGGLLQPGRSGNQGSLRSLSPSVLSSKRRYETNTISSVRSNSTFRAHVTQVTGRRQSLATLFTREDGLPASSSATSLSEVSASDEEGSRTASQMSDSKVKTPQMDSEAKERAEDKVTEGQKPRERLTVPTGPTVESPHIKHSLYHGSTKVSCVSWFAEEFAALRRRWGVEEDFAESLSKSRPWQTTGGKSKSNFFKTADDKWIGKQLLTVWSVDEKDALLEFAPAYIRYMLNADANDCPSLLVKIAGFYSLKIKDIKKGETKLRMSVMVLENVFADVKSKAIRFDLKGIKDRRAPIGKTGATGGPPASANLAEASTAPTPSASQQANGEKNGPAAGGLSEDQPAPQVCWDAEWIEQYASRAFVPESEQDLFIQAMRNDLSFLTESNVMDFSLLVGVNDAEYNDKGEQTSPPSIRVRIVDYISAFTLAKQLESSSKKALKSQEARGNVTVLPPSEYAARFEAAMLGYFIGVPGRQSAGRRRGLNVDRPLAVSSVL